MVADMEVDMVADMEVVKVADKVVDMAAEKEKERKNVCTKTKLMYARKRS